MDFIEVHGFLDGFPNQINKLRIDDGMRDENMLCPDVFVSGKLIFRIFYQDLGELSAVFSCNAHFAGRIVDLNAGL